MNCRQFRNHHVAFVDDVLSAADMRAMRDHATACDRCGQLDVQIRRSLMVVRSLPRIEPSADFMARLEVRIRAARAETREPVRPPVWARTTRTTPYAAAAAGLLLGIAATYGFTVRMRAREAAMYAPSVAIVQRPRMAPPPMASAEVVASVPAGIPVWSAVFAVGQMPTLRTTNVDFVDTQSGQ